MAGKQTDFRRDRRRFAETGGGTDFHGLMYRLPKTGSDKRRRRGRLSARIMAEADGQAVQIVPASIV
jgi:hypothetical protein